MRDLALVKRTGEIVKVLGQRKGMWGQPPMVVTDRGDFHPAEVRMDGEQDPAVTSDCVLWD